MGHTERQKERLEPGIRVNQTSIKSEREREEVIRGKEAKEGEGEKEEDADKDSHSPLRKCRETTENAVPFDGRERASSLVLLARESLFSLFLFLSFFFSQTRAEDDFPFHSISSLPLCVCVGLASSDRSKRRRREQQQEPLSE